MAETVYHGIVVYQAAMNETRDQSVRFVDSGEFRMPRKGEWYLSGATVEAYRAPNDLLMDFRIARMVTGTSKWVPDPGQL